MARVDSDRITIVRATRNQNTGAFEIEMDWFDNLGVLKGRIAVSYASEEEARATLDSQTQKDIFRPLVARLFARTDGSFARAFFDALPGKTFEIRQTIVQV